MMSKTYDVIIIGGGIMGSATAYYLMKLDSTLKVAVIERDPTYAKASTTLSMANARIQFSLKQNIEISQYALKILEHFEDTMTIQGERPKIYYRREGNLFLLSEAGRRGAEKALTLQQSLGCRADWWSPEKIKRHYPLYDTKGLVGGTFGPDDGHLDAYALLMAYRAKAKSMGARYVKDEVENIHRQHTRVTGVGTATGLALTAGCVVNCAGAWAAQVAETAGVKLPVVPVKRQVFTLDTAVKPQGPLPLTILPSGMYFRTETGGLILLGKSMEEDPIGYEFSWDDKRFMETLWPELAGFVPDFDRLKLVRGWAGLYAVNTLDGNAILGEWPEIKGLFLANGFSGHGLQQAPAVGRYLAELILGCSLSLDLSIFSPSRILENKPLGENGLV
jgi:FAD-dependent oxidoreductase domain-containing protein 1